MIWLTERGGKYIKGISLSVGSLVSEVWAENGWDLFLARLKMLAVDFENCLKIDCDSRKFSVPGSNRPHSEMWGWGCLAPYYKREGFCSERYTQYTDIQIQYSSLPTLIFCAAFSFRNCLSLCHHHFSSIPDTVKVISLWILILSGFLGYILV